MPVLGEGRFIEIGDLSLKELIIILFSFVITVSDGLVIGKVLLD